jgi:hypothetical protein
MKIRSALRALLVSSAILASPTLADAGEDIVRNDIAVMRIGCYTVIDGPCLQHRHGHYISCVITAYHHRSDRLVTFLKHRDLAEAGLERVIVDGEPVPFTDVGRNYAAEILSTSGGALDPQPDPIVIRLHGGDGSVRTLRWSAETLARHYAVVCACLQGSQEANPIAFTEIRPSITPLPGCRRARPER